MNTFTQILPPPDIKPFVKGFWMANSEDQPVCNRVFRIFSDGFPGLVFHHHNGSAVFRDADGKLMPTGFVYGQSTAPCTNYADNRYQAVGVHFEPAVIPALFRIGGTSLTNLFLDLNELAGQDMNNRLLDARSQKLRIQLLINFIRRQMKRYATTDALIEDCIKEMNRDIAVAAIPTLQRYYHISERQLQRRFKEAVGITPHLYLRVRRFQYAVRSLEIRKYINLTNLAYDSGYADQSHFIRDFKQFSGFTPKEYDNFFHLSGIYTRPNVDNLPTRVVLIVS